MSDLFWRIEQSTVELVKRDGLARMVTALEYRTDVDADGEPIAVPTGQERRDLLYFVDGAVRSMPASDWPGKLPADPTEAESQAGQAAREAAERQARQARQETRLAIISQLQSAAGKNIRPGAPNAPTAAERQALIIAMAYMLGIIDAGGTIKAPEEYLP